MYNFTDLIARSYQEYTKEDEDNIARFFFTEFCEVRPEADAKFVYTREHFFIKLIKKLDDFIKGTTHNYHIDRSYYDYDIEINETEDFEEFEKNRLIKLQDIYDNTGNPTIPKRINYEECTSAKDIKEALDYGLNLIDPVRIISVDKEIQANDLVLRKSKLEYLKTEAIRARDAKGPEELDINGLLQKDISNDLSLYNLNHSQPKREQVVEEFVFKALEIIKPLGGIYKMDNLLDDADMKRLNNYVVELIKTGTLPANLLPFPRTSLPNQFIRKTMHMVYILIGKKHRSEFIKLTHLFKQFGGTEPTTTNSKFFTYDGKYKDVITNIKF